MKQWELFELTLPPTGVDAECEKVTVTFTVGNTVTTVRGFCDGDGICKVRYLPMTTGLCRWQISGPVQGAGEEIIEPAAETVHGPVRVCGMGFAYADGTAYAPFGTTVYALAHQPDELVEQTLDTLAHAPFNKIRICVFPKHYQYNSDEPPYYPFEKTADGKWDVRRPCLAFWHRFELILQRLGTMGIQVDLILFHPYDRWGFSTMTHEEDLHYLSTVLRRLAAFPNVWWSLANEYDLLPAKSMEDWYGMESYIADNDPFHNLYSVHYCFKPWDYSRPAVTHVSAQTKTVSRVAEWRTRYKKPVIIDECCYEGNFPEPWGNLSGREMTYRFWCVAATGGYCTHGETFLDDEKEIVWWAKGGKLKGESPARIGFLRTIIESLPGTLEPIPSQMAGMIDPAGQEMIRSQLAFVPAARRHTVEMILDTAPVDLRALIENEMLYEGHCGTDAYLTFLLRQCRARTTLDLPEDGIYRVEVIDTWEITRTVAAAHASGKTTINLPGKEGIAILAVRTGNK
ncbi:apiosidase-like domain-containing protein [Gemmiger sp.]